MYNTIKQLFNKVTKTEFKPLLRTILNNQTFYDFCRSKGVELNENQSNWFTNCEKNAINLICASRQSGKTKFLTLYAEWLADVKGQTVLIVSPTYTMGGVFSDRFKNNQRIDIWIGSYTYNPLRNYYDVVLFDEMAHQSPVFEILFKSLEFKNIPRMVAISSSKPGSLFNEMVLTLPAYMPGVNITISPLLPANEEFIKYLSERSYDVYYKCALT